MNNYRYLVYSIVASIIGFGIWIAVDDHEKIFGAIQQVGWNGFLFVCFFSVINYLLRYVRWILLLRHLGDSFAFIKGLLCYVSGFALTTTPGKAGEAIRSYYFYRNHRLQHAHTLAALLSERASDALASLVIASLAIYTFESMRWLGVGFLLAVVCVVLLVNQANLLLRIFEWFRGVKIALLQKLINLIPAFLARAADLLSWRMLGLGTAIALLSWSAEAFAFAWLSRHLGGEAHILLYMSIFAIAMVAGAATFLPGGLGGTEAVMYLLLKLTGLGEAEAVAITLICRLATLWLAVILGLMSVLWLEKNQNELPVE